MTAAPSPTGGDVLTDREGLATLIERVLDRKPNNHWQVADDLIPRILARENALRAEIERVKAERAVEVGRLRAALKPFAESAPVTLSVVNERGCRFAAYYEIEQPAFRHWIDAKAVLAASGGGDDA